MKSKMLLMVVLFSMSCITLAQVPEYVRVNARGMGEAGVLKARASGINVFSAANLHRVGGVMFQGKLDDLDFVKSITKISLEKKGTMGRIWFDFSNEQEAYYEAPYWLLGPTIEYAMSDDNSV